RRRAERLPARDRVDRGGVGFRSPRGPRARDRARAISAILAQTSPSRANRPLRRIPHPAPPTVKMCTPALTIPTLTQTQPARPIAFAKVVARKTRAGPPPPRAAFLSRSYPRDLT